LFVVAPDVVFHPTNIGVTLDAVVIVGIVTSQLVAWAFPLYVSAIVQLKLAVLDNVPPLLVLIFAEYITELFFVIAYHVFPVLLLVNIVYPSLVE